MRNSISMFAASAFVIIGACPAASGGVLPLSLAEQETSLFAGLNWSFGAGSHGLSARVGAIYTDTDIDDSVTGWRAFFDHGLMDRSTRFSLTGLFGDTDHVAEFGLGYDFVDSEPFGIVGALGDFTEIGATYGFDSRTLEGYLGLHSFELDEVEVFQNTD